MSCLICGSDSLRPVGKKNGYQLVGCGPCGFRFVDPMPGGDDLCHLYDDYTETPGYFRKAEQKVQRARRRLRRYMQRAPGNRFLDVGCNIGSAVEAAIDLGLDAHGVDIDETAVRMAKELFPRGRYYAGPLDSLPAEWGAFDLIYSSEVIEHLPNPHALFAALSERAAKNALLYLTTPDAGHWRVPRDFSAWGEVKPPEHLLYFTKSTLRAFLSQHGFEMIKTEFNVKPGIRAIARKM